MIQQLNIGGMIAGGFDRSGRYLLVVSHSGRGVFSVGTWARVVRDDALAYPEKGCVPGIGPILGESIAMTEINYSTEVLAFTSPDQAWSFHYTEDMLSIRPHP